MPTVESTQPLPGTGVIAEPGEVGVDLFGSRQQTNAWQSQTPWVSKLLAPPAIAEVPPTVLSSGEVSLEKVSLTPGPVVLEVSDAEAKHIVDSHERDAFPPE